MAAWTTRNIPDQSGRIALVTGANSGLGLETARALAAKGATVVMACRSPRKAEQARQDVIAAGLAVVDLANLRRPRLMAATGGEENEGEALDLDLWGGYAYVAAGWGGLRIFDVSTPSAPAAAPTSSPRSRPPSSCSAGYWPCPRTTSSSPQR